LDRVAESSPNTRGRGCKERAFLRPAHRARQPTLGPVHTTQLSLAVIVHPAAIPFRVDEKPGQLIVASAELTVVIDKQTGALTFMKPDGAEIARECKNNKLQRQEDRGTF
jgi:hypothetical protein